MLLQNLLDNSRAEMVGQLISDTHIASMIRFSESTVRVSLKSSELIAGADIVGGGL